MLVLSGPLPDSVSHDRSLSDLHVGQVQVDGHADDPARGAELLLDAAQDAVAVMIVELVDIWTQETKDLIFLHGHRHDVRYRRKIVQGGWPDPSMALILFELALRQRFERGRHVFFSFAWSLRRDDGREFDRFDPVSADPESANPHTHG
jgi:hypothetical protein